MAQTGTTPVGAPIDTYGANDPYPSHIANRGKGGLHSYHTIAERDAISLDRRYEGMEVNITDDGSGNFAKFRLKSPLTNSDWVNITLPAVIGSGDMTKAVYDTNNDGVVDHAAVADNATTANTAIHADSADEADHAASADDADHATQADNADTATLATNALHANDADLAADSLHANEADHTIDADHALEADHATDADTADTATFATTAGGAPPTGAAGGHLTGNYPNPTIPASSVTQHQTSINHNLLLNYDIAEHRKINDSSNTTIELFSASKILALLAGISAGITPVLNCKTLAIANIVLAGLQTINGYVLADGERVMLTGQTTASENGIWLAHAGAWTRPTDFSDPNVVTGVNCFIEGVSSSYVGYQCLLITIGAIVVDTTNLTFINIPRVTLGVTAGTAAAGNDSRIPTQDENNALVGTSGVVSALNKYVTDADPRNNNSRTPNGAAGGDLIGTYPNPAVNKLSIAGGAQGTILYHNGTAWVVLTPGTLGQVLQTGGVGGNPSWVNVAGGGNPTGAAGGNLGGTYPNPIVTGLTITGEAQGDILYRNATTWVRLPAGTSGQFLKTNGAGVNPVWASVGSAPTGSAGGQLGGTYPNPTVVDLTLVGQVAGNTLWFNGTNWARIPNGTSGQVLQSNGATIPTWVNAPASSPIGAAGGNLAGTYPNPIVVGLTITAQTSGDMLFYNGTAWTRFGMGANGTYLKSNGIGSTPSWATPATGGNAPYNIVYKNANYTIATTDDLIVLDTSGGTISLTLLAATNYTKPVTIKKAVGDNDVSIILTGADTLDGAGTSVKFDAGFQNIQIVALTSNRFVTLNND